MGDRPSSAIPGTLVHKGRPLLRAVGGHADLDDELSGAFAIERHRDFDHDPRLGQIALGETAGRALAPETHDPGAAIEVLNALLGTLSELPAQPPSPDEEQPPVYGPHPSVDDLIRAGFAPIMREGAGEDEVTIRALKVLHAVGGTRPHAFPTTQALANELKQNVERMMPDQTALARTLAVYQDQVSAAGY
ncbi:DUF2254 family protein [Sphingomonas parapaucimobilis]|uniref:DUF2254 family protein n=1 Tax=Sphingomonas parapaucimobilis TaxID=28213 RepID=UPI00391B9BC2